RADRDGSRRRAQHRQARPRRPGAAQEGLGCVSGRRQGRQALRAEGGLTMTVHSERAHATWSASATARNWNCSGALALGATVAKLDIESEAAAWGTACHQVSEKCLRDGFDADTLVGTTEKTKRHSFDVDEEMADCSQ